MGRSTSNRSHVQTCPRCAAVLQPNSAYCGICRYDLTVVAPVAPPQPVTVEAPAPVEAPPVVSAPVAQAPVVEAPVVDAPVTEAPVAEPTPAAPAVVAEAAAPEAPVASAPVFEVAEPAPTPVAAVAAPVEESPAVDASTAPVADVAPVAALGIAPIAGHPDDIEGVDEAAKPASKIPFAGVVAAVIALLKRVREWLNSLGSKKDAAATDAAASDTVASDFPSDATVPAAVVASEITTSLAPEPSGSFISRLRDKLNSIGSKKPKVEFDEDPFAEQIPVVSALPHAGTHQQEAVTAPVYVPAPEATPGAAQPELVNAAFTAPETSPAAPSAPVLNGPLTVPNFGSAMPPAGPPAQAPIAEAAARINPRDPFSFPAPGTQNPTF